MGEPAQQMHGAKLALRRRLLAHRGALPDRAPGDAARTAQILAHPLIQAARTVAAYVSFGTEPDTSALRLALSARGATVLLPQLTATAGLTFHTETGAGRPLGDADVVLVPALAVDQAGRRLGRGGGSYDRVLGAVTVPVLALLHPGELLAWLPHEAHDIAVTGVALPGGIAWLVHRLGPHVAD